VRELQVLASTTPLIWPFPVKYALFEACVLYCLDIQTTF
jgi:hypothetical protein